MHLELTTYHAADILAATAAAHGWHHWQTAPLLALVRHLEAREQDLGEPLRLDPVAVLVEYRVYPDAWSCVAEYVRPGDPAPADLLAWLRDRADVVEYPGGLLVSAF